LLGHSSPEAGVDPVDIGWARKDGTILKLRLSGREVNSKDGRMNGYEIIAEDLTQQRELEDHLRLQAAKDPLTGLANYRHLVAVLDAEIKRSKRTGREFALLLLDLDQLKQVNDRFGHVTGSQALCRLADALCICCRDIDTAARFGGDEFAVVLPETGAESANLVARRVRGSFANDGREPKLSVSTGVAVYPKDGKTIDTLLPAADAAMYAMKRRSAQPQRGPLAKTEIANLTSESPLTAVGTMRKIVSGAVVGPRRVEGRAPRPHQTKSTRSGGTFPGP
jgi:diguanylate cyclase (GGDEF)-like protein